MWNSKFRKQLIRAVSVFSAVALVIPYVPGQAKTSKKSKVTDIQLVSPLSETGRKVNSTLTMKKGSKFRIKAGLLPVSAKKSTLSYKSSKKKIAVVSKKGVIKAKKKGKTTVTVSPKENKKVKAVIKVTVTNSLRKVKKIKLDKNAINLSLEKGKNSTKLKANITSPKKSTNKKINWISDNKKIATVNKSGTVTAKSAGSTKITAVAADGRGAKAVCRVIVNNITKDTPAPVLPPGILGTNSPVPTGAPGPAVTKSPSPSMVPSAMPSVSPSVSPSMTPPVNETISISGVEGRQGIKQGESIQLTAKGDVSGAEKEGVTWSVNSMAGVSISESGLLTVAADAQASKKVTVTAKMNENTAISASISLKIVENQSLLGDKQMQLNEVTEDNPQGLSYRVADDGTKAYSTVVDPERGSVTRIDEAIGYKNDMIAWLTVDPLYAGKTVSISAYVKYDGMETRNSIGLVLNERWNYSNPAAKWNAEPDTWHYVSGTFTLPEYKESRYDGTKNNLFLSRFSELEENEHPVYYLSDLVISVEKAEVESVILSTGQEENTVYQNHTLQCSAEVKGTGNPIQKVNYSIEPEVEHVSISDSGLLTVGNAEADSVINIKATSVEDPDKYDVKTLTVLPQTIDLIEITAPEDVTEIYQNNELQMNAQITSQGEPSEAVTWSIFPAVDGATISDTGLLTVGDVKGDTELHIKATSVFDPSKSDDYTVTVRANTINGVTVETAGNKTTVSSELPLNLNAVVDATGTPSKNVTWSIPVPVDGVSITPSGNNCTLSVTDAVADGTKITIKAVSEFDASKFGQIIVTVSNVSSEEFDLNKLTVEQWEDFEGVDIDSVQTAMDRIGISYKSTLPDTWNLYDISNKAQYQGGVLKLGETGSAARTDSMRYVFGNADDYLQFQLKNEGDRIKTYTLSFMFRFTGIANENGTSDYKLPLKFVALDETNNETVLKDGINLPYRCYATSTIHNKAFYEISATVDVPAGKTLRLQLKLAGDLPTTCLSSEHSNVSHPVECSIDNVSISSGSPFAITVKKGETYQLNLDTVSTDTVKYYTNCYLTKYTHDNSNRGSKVCTCNYFDTIVASVDEKGLITASEVGETALIAVITHADGTVDRKQCIVKVTK